MKMKTRIISLSILAILTVCLLNVAAASATAAAPHRTIITAVKTHVNVKQAAGIIIYTDTPTINSGDTITFYGMLYDTNGNGIGGQSGTLSYLSSGMSTWQTATTFTTQSNGNWSARGSFTAASGDYWFAAQCDGASAQTIITVS
jgi:hypothetical protein